MNAVEQKVWFLRGGLFAKYVIALVGLVVFVLAVNGAVETWISYRATKTTLIDALGDKAEATARRIEQSIADLERQISWVTRASAKTTLEQHYADYVQLLNQVAAVSQLTLLDQNGREQLRLSRTTIAVGSGTDLSRDVQMAETFTRGISYAPAFFRGTRTFMSIAVSHSGANEVTVAEIDLRLLSDFFGDAQVGRAGFAYLIDSKGKVLASSSKGPDAAKDVSWLPQVAALLKPDRTELASGTDANDRAVLTASNAGPKLAAPLFFRSSRRWRWRDPRLNWRGYALLTLGLGSRSWPAW
jgi:hypothetical protein